MSEYLNFQGRSIEVHRRLRRRSLGLSVYPNGTIKISANKTTSQKNILKFLENHRDWIRKSLQETEQIRQKYPQRKFHSGESYPYLGHQYDLVIEKGSPMGLKFLGNKLVFTCPKHDEELTREERQRYFTKFKKAYKKVAERLMTSRLEYYSHLMGLFPSGVQFRGQKSIWGSCSPENKISLNYKLIVSPLEVIDYVIIHELAHIRHKDHSKRFWNLVEQHTNYRHQAKDWLRQHQYEADFLAKKSELHPQEPLPL